MIILDKVWKTVRGIALLWVLGSVFLCVLAVSCLTRLFYGEPFPSSARMRQAA